MGAGDVPLNFGGLAKPFCAYDTSRVVILPVPYEGTTTYKTGTRHGPESLMDASRNMELYDETLGIETFRIGIHTHEEVPPAKSPEAMTSVLIEQTSELLRDGKFVVTVGGEHSVTLGPVQAHAHERSNLSILHLDAHTDLRDSYEGTRYGHGCVMRRCVPFGPITQVGVRSLSAEEAVFLEEAATVTTFFAHELHDMPAHCDEIVSTLTDEVYVTIDVDVFDPAVMPATGTPEPGGLSWYDVTTLLARVAQEKDVIGFDVVELLPTSGLHACEFLAAKLVYRFLGLLVEPKGWTLR